MTDFKLDDKTRLDFDKMLKESGVICAYWEGSVFDGAVSIKFDGKPFFP